MRVWGRGDFKCFYTLDLKGCIRLRLNRLMGLAWSVTDQLNFMVNMHGGSGAKNKIHTYRFYGY